MHIFGFSDGLARVKKDGYLNKKRIRKGEKKEPDEWIFLDKNFNEVLKIFYYWVGDFKDGLAKSIGNGYVAFINKKGEEIIKVKVEEYEWVDDFQEGFARVQFKTGEMGFIDKAGKIIYQTSI